MGVNLSTATCFLPFNNSVSEDLTGNTEWEIAGSKEQTYCSIINSCPKTPVRNVLYLENDMGSSAPIYLTSKPYNYNFETNDFTISFWLKRINVAIGHVPFLFADSNGTVGMNMLITADYGVQIGAIDINVIKEVYGMGIKWNHYCLVRSNGTLTFYLNGKVKGTYNLGTNTLGTASVLRIGQWGVPKTRGDGIGGGMFFMSEFILDIGHAWYTDEFTPVSFLNNNMMNNLSLGE